VSKLLNLSVAVNLVLVDLFAGEASGASIVGFAVGSGVLVGEDFAVR